MTLSDDQLHDLLAGRADRARPAGLDALIAHALAAPAPRSPLRGLGRGRAAVLALAALLVASMLVSPIGPLSVLFGVTPVPSPSPTAPVASATPAPTPTPTDLMLTPPPYAAGTCPVTPITDLAGGAVPEVAMSGVRWRWGPDPWRARLGQKVVLVPNGGSDAYLDVDEISAERLPIGPSGSPMSIRFPKGGGPGFVFGVGLPESGCWLLTAIGSMASSSVVVDVGPAPADVPSPESQNVPTTTAGLRPLATCPTSEIVQDSGYPAFVDGEERWTNPDPKPWLAGTEHKLVVLGGTDSVIAVAAPVGIPAAGSGQRPSFITEHPVFATPPPGSGSLGLLFTIPTAGCWSVSFIEGDRTSTIVAEVGPPGSSSGGITSAQAVERARSHTSMDEFVSAFAGTFRDLNVDPYVGAGAPVKPDDLVWAVTFAGAMTICSPAGTCQSPRPGIQVVFLDYRTGAYLMVEGVSPAP